MWPVGQTVSRSFIERVLYYSGTVSNPNIQLAEFLVFGFGTYLTIYLTYLADERLRVPRLKIQIKVASSLLTE